MTAPDMRDMRARVEPATGTLLDPACDAVTREAAVRVLHDALAEVAGVRGDGAYQTWDGLDLPDGLALSPDLAAGSVFDHARVASYLRGVDAAVRAVRARRPGARARVVYAGTGPLAPLVLPLVTVHGADVFGLTLIDAHEAATAALARVVDALGAAAWIDAIVAADATRHCPAVGEAPDVLVIAATQRALTREPQVALTVALAPHLAPDGVLVPRRIDVAACLADARAEFTGQGERRRIPLGVAFTLDARSHERLVTDAAGAGVVAGNVVAMPAAPPAGLGLHMLTQVTTWDDGVTRLDVAEGASGVTLPYLVPGAAARYAGRSVRFDYHLGPRPGLHISVVDAGASS